MAEERTIVSADLPKELVKWMDLRLAQKRLEALQSGKEDSVMPTRSSFIRDLIIKAKNNGNK
jgi:hypothetical protein